MFAKRLQRVDEMVLILVVKVLMVLIVLMKVLMLVFMMSLREGVESTGGDFGSGSPSDLRRRQPADSLLGVFDLCHRLLAICVRGPLYRQF